AEIQAGGQLLTAKVAHLKPCWLAVVGVTVYRTAFGRPGAKTGMQEELMGGARLWVLPNPSGLNASWTTPKLTEAFGELGLHAEGLARSTGGEAGVAHLASSASTIFCSSPSRSCATTI